MTMRASARTHAASTSLRTDDGRIVIAGVGYLNARPLVDPIDHDDFRKHAELIRGTSAEVARMVSEEEASVGLMPVAVAASLGDVVIVPGAAIGCVGPVRSVALFAEQPLDELDTIYLDATSRTSVILARLVVALRRKKPIRWQALPPQEAIANIGGRAGAMLIADNALNEYNKHAWRLDLGQAWFEDTGKPFVFAAWCARDGVLNPDDAHLLNEAAKRGLEQRSAIARHYATTHNEDLAFIESYLTESIRYGFAENESSALQLFFDRASTAGFLPKTQVRLFDQKGSAQVPASLQSETKTKAVRASLDTILSRASTGERISAAEAERLYTEANLFDLGVAADLARRRKNPQSVVTYIVDRNVNYTNVCTTSCRFCAFYRPLGHAESYVLTREELGQKLQEVVDAGGVQILLQGGLHPELRIEWYEDLFRWMKATYKLGLHALSPEEILHLSRLENISVGEVLRRLREAGLDSVPGGGAEILTDRVRQKIAKAKCTSEEWLHVMRVAHHMGLRSSATMMYGTTDTERDRVLHLLKIRDLQDETGGFTAFFCWDYQYQKGVKQKSGDTGTNYYLRTQALSRLVLDNVDHVGASWVTQGPGVGEIALRFGADDFGSVMFEENVVSSAGTTFCINASAIEDRIHAAGFKAVRRNVRYEWLSEPV